MISTPCPRAAAGGREQGADDVAREVLGVNPAAQEVVAQGVLGGRDEDLVGDAAFIYPLGELPVLRLRGHGLPRHGQPSHKGGGNHAAATHRGPLSSSPSAPPSLAGPPPLR